MAVYLRRGTIHQDDESVFISMTDIMISLLFIVIILMAFFAMQMRTTEKTISLSIHNNEIFKRDQTIEGLRQEVTELRAQKDELDRTIERLEDTNQALTDRNRELDLNNRALSEKNQLQLSEIEKLKEEVEKLKKERQKALDLFLAGVAKRKQRIMERIADKIREKVPTIQVHVDHRQGVIRFDNRDLFGSGQWRVSNTSRTIMQVIADAIFKVLPCFTTGSHSRFASSCNPEFAIIDAIQIEGHTDDQQTSASLRAEYINDNLELSVRRATMTYRTMVTHRPELGLFENAEDPAQPVLSVSGYGHSRPIADNATKSGRELNRRIDLRFIMMTPQSLQEVKNFKDRLLSGARRKRPVR